MQDPNVIGLILNAGLAGITLFLFLKGWVVPKPSGDRLVRELEQWRKLYETERAAHDLTRKAHAEETRAALQAAAESSQTAMALLEEIRKRQSEAHS
ncbi:hypothetical protein FH608_046005 [Nonomuraea phyllanthi]|uniref:Uncharacterized protein n=1 Tax=Nonomuraea phyllanthi TaxID=2219224 RepID=A0A5C4V631_9ACTN|nr:hypothetical protein [Nonomuraea phyllanthi]KAB8186850.1 hypothetical protein FH608_046005 [Nonomuraea phyllanthi]